MLKLHDVDYLNRSEGLAAPTNDGFTPEDLSALEDVHAAAAARNLWGRGQLVSNEFAHYLAVWRPETDATTPPALAVARFRRTGTYVLTIGTTVVATGKKLKDILPALSSGSGTTRAFAQR
jgi:hypothetical protein